jgi:multidrug efflux pump subunit AcrA (membrane-fusion protein)
MKPALLIAGITILLISCQKKRETARPQFRSLTESVYASGNILPDNEYKLYALADGYLTKRLVDEGDTVRVGQVLFALESDQQNIRVGNARTNYETARVNAAAGSPVLAELEASLQSARAKMQQDSVNYTRYKNLWDNNATSRIEFERATLAYRTSRNDFAALQSRLQRTRTQLQSDLTNARSQYELSAVEKGNYQLTSRINGRVYEVYKEPGELVRRGEAVALLGDQGKVYLRLSVDELDVEKVKRGQSVLVKLDSYPDKVWKATITKVYPMLNTRDRTFRVDAHFTETVPPQYSGLTAEANVIVRQNPKALAIPKTFLVGKDSVTIEKDGELQKIRIRKGVENMEFVEVTAGLTPEMMLVK